MYKEFLIITIIIIVHELGHTLMALKFNWQLDKISIYPFGGCVKFSEDINRPLYQEFLILIAGPLIQILLFLFILILYKNNLLSSRNFMLFESYHYTLLIFNLMPIYPLDGGKLLNIILNYFMPYKKGNKLVIFLSVLVDIILVINIKNINFLFMAFLLMIEIYIYYKRQDYLYNKFLLERYLNNYNFKKIKIINNKDNMYKEKKHILKENKMYFTEKQYLTKRFRNRRNK